MQRAIEKEPPCGWQDGGDTAVGTAAKQSTALIHSTTAPTDAGGTHVVGDHARRARGIELAELRYCDEVEQARRRAAVCETTIAFVMGLAAWRNFWTLTLSDEVVGDKLLSAEQLLWKFRYLLRVLNADLFGKRYTQSVHHSYFAYAIGIEPHHTRNQIHAHVIADRPVNFALAHRVWNKVAGFAWIEQVYDYEQSVRYTCKYITKGGQLHYYKPHVYKEPSFKPMWYLDD